MIFLLPAITERMGLKRWVIRFVSLPFRDLKVDVEKPHAFKITIDYFIVVVETCSESLHSWGFIIEKPSLSRAILFVLDFWSVLKHSSSDGVRYHRLSVLTDIWLLRWLEIRKDEVNWSFGLRAFGYITCDSIRDHAITIFDPAASCLLCIILW